MLPLNKRTNILFTKDLWEKLVDLAKLNNSSVGQLVREAVEEKYLKINRFSKRQKAIESTLRERAILKGKIDYKKLIDYGRKY